MQNTVSPSNDSKVALRKVSMIRKCFSAFLFTHKAYKHVETEKTNHILSMSLAFGKLKYIMSRFIGYKKNHFVYPKTSSMQEINK